MASQIHKTLGVFQQKEEVMECPYCHIELDEDCVCVKCGYDAVEEYEEKKRRKIQEENEY